MLFSERPSREVAQLTAREAFGEGAILGGRSRRTAGVVTRTRTKLLKLPAAAVVDLLPLGLDEAGPAT